MSEAEKAQAIVEEVCGLSEFARRMGHGITVTSVRSILTGERVPSRTTRLRMVEASEGRLTEADIVAITGRETARTEAKLAVDPMWEMDDDARRDEIIRRAAANAKKQRQSNRRRIR